MCGRSSLTKTEKELEERFNATFYSEELERYNPLPNFNVAPTHMHPVQTNQDPEHLHFYKWGLVPFWAKDPKIGYRMINARIETVAEKPSYKNALRKRRCLVPFDGYYEWIKEGKQKLPFRIQTKDQEIFCVAGLWETWKDPEGSYLHTFTLLTQPASEGIAHIHDRMPVILLKDQEEQWIDDELNPIDVLETIQPYTSDQLDYYRVSTRVNSVRENDDRLIEPIKG